MAEVGTAYVRVALDTREVQKGIKNISNLFTRIQKNSAQRLTRALANLASIHMFRRMTSEAKEFERSISLISGRLVMTTDRLANMQLAFNRFNKSGEGLKKTLGTIAGGLAAVKFGDGKFVSKLAAMGIRYRTSTGGRKSAQQIMYEMADWTKSQLARGRSESDLRYLLQNTFGIDDATFEAMKEGSQKMKAIEKDFQDATGGIKTENTQKLRKALDRLSNTFDTLSKKVVENLAPLFTKIIEWISEIGEWLTRNSEFSSIIAGIIALLSALTTMKWVLGIGSLLSGVAGSGAGVVGVLGKVIGLFGGLTTVLGALAFAVGGVVGYFAGKDIGDWIGDKWSKWFGSGDRTTEEFWDNAVEEGKMPWQAAELGKEQFVPGYKEKPKMSKQSLGLIDRHNLAMAYARQQISFEDVEAVKAGRMTLQAALDKKDYISQEQADINLERAIESGEIIITNDIAVDVDVDKNGGVETNISSNGQTSSGETNTVNYTARTA